MKLHYETVTDDYPFYQSYSRFLKKLKELLLSIFSLLGIQNKMFDITFVFDYQYTRKSSFYDTGRI